MTFGHNGEMAYEFSWRIDKWLQFQQDHKKMRSERSETKQSIIRCAANSKEVKLVPWLRECSRRKLKEECWGIHQNNMAMTRDIRLAYGNAWNKRVLKASIKM